MLFDDYEGNIVSSKVGKAIAIILIDKCLCTTFVVSICPNCMTNSCFVLFRVIEYSNTKSEKKVAVGRKKAVKEQSLYIVVLDKTLAYHQ